MANKQQVIDMNAKHPEMTAREIADALDCSSAYVRATGQRNELTFARGVHGKLKVRAASINEVVK